MKRKTVFATAVFAALLSLAALGIGAAVNSPSTLMSPADYEVGRRAIEADSRLAMARCRESRLEVRELCRAQARADARVRFAELEASYLGTVSAVQAARQARARALYEVARARCETLDAAERPECLRAARQAQRQALSAEAGTADAAT